MQMVSLAVQNFADVAELADAHGSGPCAARLKGSTPFVGTICGYGITAVHQPSKLVIGVRPPLPAPKLPVGLPSGQRRQTVNLLAQLSMVRIHLPPPFLTSERQQSLPFFTIYAFNSRNLSYIKLNQSVGSKSWESAKWIPSFIASS